MMDRRFFLKLTGLVAAASALDVLPVAAQGRPVETLQPPGAYQITGRVRLQAPLVEISGISNAQQISWSAGAPTMASFSSFEYFPEPWSKPSVQVRGGQLEALAVTPVYLG
jgi:hypothetical protein